MNVMWLDTDLDEAAAAHPTKYTKLILEAGQCLSSALHNNGLAEASPYGAGYNDHPISRWAGESQQNWFQLLDYMSALHDHFYGYTYAELRDMTPHEVWSLWYRSGAIHKTLAQFVTAPSLPEAVTLTFPDIGPTPRPKCVLGFCVEESVTETYRKYITCVKYHYDWFEWSDGEPAWFSEIRRAYPATFRKGVWTAAEDQNA